MVFPHLVFIDTHSFWVQRLYWLGDIDIDETWLLRLLSVLGRRFSCWFVVELIVGFCICSMFCCALLCVLACFTIILMEKRELVALICLPGVLWLLWLFLTVPLVGLQCVIVVIPDVRTCSFEVRIYHHGAVGWSAVCNCGNSWCTHLQFWGAHLSPRCRWLVCSV